ncbi:unnamed protein product [Calypogeia fissa]
MEWGLFLQGKWGWNVEESGGQWGPDVVILVRRGMAVTRAAGAGEELWAKWTRWNGGEGSLGPNGWGLAVVVFGRAGSGFSGGVSEFDANEKSLGEANGSKLQEWCSGGIERDRVKLREEWGEELGAGCELGLAVFLAWEEFRGLMVLSQREMAAEQESNELRENE